MTDAKKEKQKKKLIDLGLMESEDTLVDFFQANYFESLIGKMGQWKQGWVYFTEERLIVITGLLSENIVIPYKSIRELAKCSQMFIPMGIAITHDDEKKGETVIDKISVMKRSKWLEFLANKAGLTL